MKAAALVLLTIQVLGVLVVLFGDIGFDHPGSFGLDFGHFLLIAAIEGISLVVLAALSAAKKQWWPVSASGVIVAAGVALVFAVS